MGNATAAALRAANVAQQNGSLIRLAWQTIPHWTRLLLTFLMMGAALALALALPVTGTGGQLGAEVAH